MRGPSVALSISARTVTPSHGYHHPLVPHQSSWPTCTRHMAGPPGSQAVHVHGITTASTAGSAHLGPVGALCHPADEVHIQA